MKARLHTEPDPIDDPAQLIEYLESFYGMAQLNITRADYSGWLENLRADMRAIKDETIRAKAIDFFRHVESGAYVLPKHPEMKDSVVLPAIRRLIDYLREAFGIPQ